MLVIRLEKRKPLGFPFTLLAESEGFKPPIPGKGIPDFESSAFGHSANSPIKRMSMSLLICGCKGSNFFRFYQINQKKFSLTCCEVAQPRFS